MYKLKDTDEYMINEDYYERDNSDHNSKDKVCNKCSNSIKVLGKGSVNVKPDVVQVFIGVITENKELEAAQKENARITNQVIKSIIGLGVLPRYIQTQSYNIRTNYDYIEGKQVFRGYEVSNNLKVVIRNINSAGEIIDTAVENGANSVSGINFIVSDETKYYYEALELAVADAQGKAFSIVNKLKVNLNITPIQITELERQNITPPGVMTFKAVSETTPIEVGENTINAEIECIFIFNN